MSKADENATEKDRVLERIRSERVLPVIVIDEAARAVPLARALFAGGIGAVEITFRTAQGVESLRRIAAECPEMLAGAGTVLSPAQAAAARDAGARFVVAPGFNPRVVEYCLEHDMAVFPGVCTPTELEAVMERGLRVVKFFPAEPMGGVSFLKAIAAPYTEARFIPTGGITAANVGQYLALPSVVACGGSWMAPSAWISAGQFERITDETTRAVAAVRPAVQSPGTVVQGVSP